MHFGLTNGPATFQTLMNRVLQPFLGKFVVVFIDDILIYSKTSAEHVGHVREVLQALQREQLYCKPSKCVFEASVIKFLGHVFSGGTIAVDTDKTAAVETWPVPRHQADVRQFVGMTNFFRRFIPKFAEMAAPLNDLLGANKGPFRWEPVHQAAFAAIKRALVSPPVLQLPVWEEQFTVTADASDVATGAVLSQGGKPVAYMSSKLGPAERNYTPDERETLAAVQACAGWKHYLFAKFVLETDSSVVKHLFTKRGDLTRRQQRWVEVLTDFDFQVVQVKSKDNRADAFTRRSDGPTVEAIPKSAAGISVEPLEPLEADAGDGIQAALHNRLATVWEPKVLERIRQGYAEDAVALRIIQRLGEDGREPARAAHPTDSPVYLWRDGLLLLMADELSGEVVERIYVPAVGTLRVDLLKLLHESPVAGHPGRDRMLDLLHKSLYWPKLAKDVKAFVASCDLCQRSKPLNRRAAPPVQPLEIPTGRWTHQAMDFLTGLPVSEGADAILTVVDRGTHRVHFIPTTKDVTAAGVAQLYVDNVVRLHGLPRSLVSDRDKLFTSLFWKALMERLGVELHPSTANHPQSDGASERMHRTLVEMLRMFVSHHQNDWRKHLAMCEFAINNNTNASTGMSAFFADLGYHPISGFPQAAAGEARNVLPSEGEPVAVGQEAAQQFAAAQHRTYQEAVDCMLEAQERMHALDGAVAQGRAAADIKVGDMVLVSSQALLSPAQRDRPALKLAFKWQGPFRVLECMAGGAALRLDLGRIRAHPVINRSFLRLYADPADIPGRQQLPPEPVVGGGEEPEWEVEEVVAHKKSRHAVPRWQFTVKWQGLGVGSNSVEPLDSFVDQPEYAGGPVSINAALLAYAHKHPEVLAELRRRGFAI